MIFIKLLLLAIVLIGLICAYDKLRRWVARKHYWHALYLLYKEEEPILEPHLVDGRISTNDLAHRLGVGLWVAESTVFRLNEDGYVNLWKYERPLLVRISFAGKDLIRESHEILKDQPWYEPPTV